MTPTRFEIRLADVSDAVLIASHRARMFQEMGLVPESLFEAYRAKCETGPREMLQSGEYIGWLTWPNEFRNKIVAGVGVQLRRTLPHPVGEPGGEIAIAEGRIRSVDDRAEVYVPALAGTEYGRTSIRHLLQMSSGVRFREEYTGDDDVSLLARDTFMRLGKGGVEAVKRFNERVAPAGTRFSYASVETQVLGFVLTGAVGRSASEYLEQKIWQPIGAEGDATWLIDRSGQEATLCCLNAVLRDYARLGLLLAHDGNWRGQQIIPAAWVRDATSRHPDQPHLWPGTATPFLGYGYQTWIWPGEARRFAFLGIRGQSILVDPQSRLVMVQTSVRKRPSNDPSAALTRALWEAVAATLGN
jgi:CubicO group peptidase (beta-lactamase class C family)